MYLFLAVHCSEMLVSVLLVFCRWSNTCPPWRHTTSPLIRINGVEWRQRFCQLSNVHCLSWTAYQQTMESDAFTTFMHPNHPHLHRRSAAGAARLLNPPSRLHQHSRFVCERLCCLTPRGLSSRSKPHTLLKRWCTRTSPTHLVYRSVLLSYCTLPA
jgi:hypothetical protein